MYLETVKADLKGCIAFVFLCSRKYWRTWSVKLGLFFFFSFEISLGYTEAQQLRLSSDTDSSSWEAVRWLCLHGLVQNPSSEKKRGYWKNTVQVSIPLKDYVDCQAKCIGKSVWAKVYHPPLHIGCFRSTAGFPCWCSSFVQKLYPGWTTGPRPLSLCPVVILRLCQQKYFQIRREIFSKHSQLIYLCSLLGESGKIPFDFNGRKGVSTMYFWKSSANAFPLAFGHIYMQNLLTDFSKSCAWIIKGKIGYKNYRSEADGVGGGGGRNLSLMFLCEPFIKNANTYCFQRG